MFLQYSSHPQPLFLALSRNYLSFPFRFISVLNKLIAQGCSNQEISNQLFISLHTVKTHASHINSKLGADFGAP